MHQKCLFCLLIPAYIITRILFDELFLDRGIVFSQTLNCILITDIMLRFVDLTLINSIFELSSTITLPSQTHRLTK